MTFGSLPGYFYIQNDATGKAIDRINHSKVDISILPPLGEKVMTSIPVLTIFLKLQQKLEFLGIEFSYS